MEKISIDSVYTSIKEYDVFMCCSSFEDRCLEVARRLDKGQFQYVAICRFDERYGEENDNFIKLRELFRGDCDVIYLSKEHPLENYDKIFDKLSKLKFHRALLDISTFTREMFLIVIKLFKQKPFEHVSLTICYNPSDKYSSNSQDVHNLWLSKGVSAIRSVVGYAGDLSPIKDNLLVVLVGFEAERSQILIDSFEPEQLYIGRASKEESMNDEVASINADNFERLLSQNNDAHEFVFSCKSINLTKRELVRIVEENREQYNIIISPMCNKISTLAVAAIAFKYPEIQICYASANLYNTKAYSESSGYVYVIETNELSDE